VVRVMVGVGVLVWFGVEGEDEIKARVEVQIGI